MSMTARRSFGLRLNLSSEPNISSGSTNKPYRVPRRVYAGPAQHTWKPPGAWRKRSMHPTKRRFFYGVGPAISTRSIPGSKLNKVLIKSMESAEIDDASRIAVRPSTRNVGSNPQAFAMRRCKSWLIGVAGTGSGDVRPEKSTAKRG